MQKSCVARFHALLSLNFTSQDVTVRQTLDSYSAVILSGNTLIQSGGACLNTVKDDDADEND